MNFPMTSCSVRNVADNVYILMSILRLSVKTFNNDAYGTNHIEAELLVVTFVKGLCRGTISLYLDL